ncbi:MAG: phenylacetic acid degradation protein PaaY [Betaproteobacteria bacterium]|jgi:phenylacetic acid degradation protein|nr:phenylacetic acid degradation protein PaaY [Rhodocyclaceae bacterium]MCA3134377.1 phenylacetic acid degradation protein PaaY [Rhodocyclaceae bacterium]MCA3141160.1 phenylacetic acid degradation protein PaaY [Rhodocyclaceae bacterium]MCA3145059.1 phenylacetic acid degradation protein PaaY [Rhodocyclaceae bacterium]MCE2897906.1 phenylacetic acid degradation protein PaaY [Betaproteobacteria bacterium]
MPCYEIDGLRPVVHPEAWIHPTAVLIGDVLVGPGCYVGPVCSLRGDFGRLVLEAGANFQDTCVMHGFPDTDTVVEQDGHIGHGAVLHGCIVRRNGMVGMNAVVMDKAVVGDSAIVAACAFVKAGMEIPPGVLVAGVPGKVVRELTEAERAWKVAGTRQYHELALRSRTTLRECQPLAAPEPGRARLDFGGAVKPLMDTKRG